MSMCICHECGELWDTKSDKGLNGVWTDQGEYICPVCTDYLMELAEELNHPQAREDD